MPNVEPLTLLVDDGPRPTVLTCRAILFDMDGTLVDSTVCVEQVWRDWAVRNGVDVASLLAFAHGRRNQEVLRAVAPHLETPETLAALERSEEDCRQGVREVPGARALLSQLPVGRWAVVTSAWRTLAQIRLGCAGLPTPEIMICADDVAVGKPDPAGYRAAARALSVSPADCVVIEDAVAGVQAGIAAGMQVVGVTTTYPRESLPCRLCIPDLTALRRA